MRKAMHEYGPRSLFSDKLHQTKYREDGETFYDTMVRIAATLGEGEEHRHEFKDILLEQRFLPAGRIQAAIGATRKVTAINCLSGNTEILTLEYGSVPIAEVSGKVVHLLDGERKWVPCPILYHGIQTTYELVFKRGFEKKIVRSTLDHGWVCKNKTHSVFTKAFFSTNKKKEIDDLRPSKNIIDQAAYRRGVVHGLIYGDGSKQTRGFGIRVCSKHEDTEKWLSDFPKHYSPSCEGDPTYFIAETKAWCNLKEFPIDPSSDYLLGFLRGWFLADGCVSTQPEAIICCGKNEEAWLKKWGPIVGWHVRGSSKLLSETNYGKRKKESINVRLKPSSMDEEDFLSTKHKDKWKKNRNKRGLGWRVHGQPTSPKEEKVYCPVVPTTHSFALSCGIHSRNCFVSGAIEDTLCGENGIMQRATEAAQTMRMGGGIGYDFCLSPESLVLTADLDWVKAKDIKIGDELVGFPEKINLQKNTFSVTQVTANEKLRTETIEIVTNKNTTIVSSNHKFVVRRLIDTPHKLRNKGYKWVCAKDLQPGDNIAFIGIPWNNTEWLTHDAGWLVGCKLSTKSSPPAIVISKRSLGVNDVYSVSTKAKTLISDGFLSHNSTLRPRGAAIKSLNAQSSGPVSFMHIFNSVCHTIQSAGSRRGAQMSILRVDHPDIVEFINAKHNKTELTNFNISVAVTDEFMEAVETGTPFDLRWGDQVYQTIDAQALWEHIMRSTYDWAEPGVIFIDRINEMNNLWYCERIAATNPCSEQPLGPFGACLLGSFNLVKYVKDRRFNFDLFNHDIPIVVRAMDNVIDKTIYPLPEQEKTHKANRRMGLGVTGLANALEYMGLPYGSKEFIDMEHVILSTLTWKAYIASSLLAAEKGSFPLYDKNRYLAGNFIKNLPHEALWHINKYGIRNSHLTSIAPCGTISLTADNVSSGIEPVFQHNTLRKVKTFDGHETVELKDYGVAYLDTYGKTVDEVTTDEHIAVLLSAQKHVDSAISKTINVTSKATWDEFKSIYRRVWEGGGKGCSTFRTNGNRDSILEGAACTIDENGGKTCDQ